MADDRYWVGNGGRFLDPTHWSVSSGGAGGASAPTISNNIIFDSNSFTLPGQVVTGSNDSTHAFGVEYPCANFTVAAGTAEFTIDHVDPDVHVYGWPGANRLIICVNGDVDLNSVSCHIGIIKMTGSATRSISGVSNADFYGLVVDSYTTANLESGATLDVIDEIQYYGIFNFDSATINARWIGGVSYYGCEIHDLSGTSIINIRKVSGETYLGDYVGFNFWRSTASLASVCVVDLATTQININGDEIQIGVSNYTNGSDANIELGVVTINPGSKILFSYAGEVETPEDTVHFASLIINVSEPLDIYQMVSTSLLSGNNYGSLKFDDGADFVINGASALNTVNYYTDPETVGGYPQRWGLDITAGTFTFEHSTIQGCNATGGATIIVDDTCVNAGNNIGVFIDVTTSAATDVTATSFTANGAFSSPALEVTERGFFICSGTTGDPSETNGTKIRNINTEGFTPGAFSIPMSGIFTPSSSYRVRAYAISGSTYYYGETVTVTMEEDTTPAPTPFFGVCIKTGTYRIGGVIYTLPVLTMDRADVIMDISRLKMDSGDNAVALDAASATHYRYDSVTIGADGVIDVIKGAEFLSIDTTIPTPPDALTSHVRLGFVLVRPGITEITSTEINKIYAPPVASTISTTVSDDELAWAELTSTISISVLDQYGNPAAAPSGGWTFTLAWERGNGTLSYDGTSSDEGSSFEIKYTGSSTADVTYTRRHTVDDASPFLTITENNTVYGTATAYIQLKNVDGDKIP
jgi:hypothetical protein